METTLLAQSHLYIDSISYAISISVLRISKNSYVLGYICSSLGPGLNEMNASQSFLHGRDSWRAEVEQRGNLTLSHERSPHHGTSSWLRLSPRLYPAFMLLVCVVF